MSISIDVVPLAKLSHNKYFKEINELTSEISGNPYTEKMISQNIQTYTGQNTYIVVMHAPDSGKLMGICRLYPVSSNTDLYEKVWFKDRGMKDYILSRNVWYLSRFIIAEPFRGKGHGHAFLSIILANIGRLCPQTKFHYITLYVARNNKAALRLYRKTGFDIIGSCDLGNYDDYFMTRRL